MSDLAVINRLAEAISEARKLLVAAQGEDPPPDHQAGRQPVPDARFAADGGGVMPASGIEAARLRLAVVDGLRRWAQGSLTDQAAVELLARSCGGRLLRPGVAWVRPCRRPGWYWLDADALTALRRHAARGSEKHVLLLAALLVDGDTSTPHQRRSTGEGRRMNSCGAARAVGRWARLAHLVCPG